MILPVKGRVSAAFDEMRPLSVPPESRNHFHGAVDIAADVNTLIFAPEDGLLYVLCILRSNIHESWNEMEWRDGEKFPFQNYFYDLYGSLILLVGSETGYFHIFCHSWWNQIFNKNIVDKYSVIYQEESTVERFPIKAYHNLALPQQAREGDVIGYVGNAGFSTGPHVHYEIHDNKYQRYEDRIDPEKLFKEKGLII